MSSAMIPVAPDVLAALLALRQTDHESFDDIFRRVLADCGSSAPAKETLPAPVTPIAVRYTLLGEGHGARDANEAMMAILSILFSLSDNDARFFEELAAKVQGRSRNHLARRRDDVYPNRPDLAKYVRELPSGWFIGCNIANREKEKILHAACAIAGLVFGRDLVITLANA